MAVSTLAEYSTSMGKRKNFNIEHGNHVVKCLFWLENNNLCPEAPQKTAKFSPSKEVLNTSGEYFLILSAMNFSGVPFLLAMAYSKVSPMVGHPFLPGGSLGEMGLCLYMPKIDRERKRNAEDY